MSDVFKVEIVNPEKFFLLKEGRINEERFFIYK